MKILSRCTAQSIPNLLLLLLLLTNIKTAGQGTSQDEKISLYLRSQRYDAAIQLLNDKILNDSGCVENYINLAAALQGLKRPEESLLPLFKALQLKKSDPDILLLTGKAYSLMGLDNEAISAYRQAAASDSGSAAAQLNIADIMMERQNYNGALQIYAGLSTKDTSNPFYLRQIGFCALKSDTLELANEYFQKALLKNSRDLITLNQASIVLIRLNRLDSAETYINNALSIFPSVCQFKVLMGDLQLKRRMFNLASEWFREAIDCGDSSAAVLQKYGASLCMYANRNDSLDINAKLPIYTTANDILMKAYKASPKNLITCYYLGLTYDKLGMWEESVDYCAQAITLALPSITPDLFLQLGKSCQNRALYSQALEAYRNVLFFRKDDLEALNRITDMIEQHREPDSISAAYLTYLLEISKNTSDHFYTTILNGIETVKQRQKK